MIFQIKAEQNYKLAGWVYIDKEDDNRVCLVRNRDTAWKTQNRDTAYCLLNLCKVNAPDYKWELATL